MNIFFGVKSLYESLPFGEINRSVSHMTRIPGGSPGFHQALKIPGVSRYPQRVWVGDRFVESLSAFECRVAMEITGG